MNEQEMMRFIDGFMIDIKKRCYAWMELRAGSRILDAGCGPGLDVRRIRDLDVNAVEAVGVDLNVSLWHSEWRAMPRPNRAFICADAARLPFNGSTFDVIWSDRLLQHVADPENTISEFKRVLKPRGRMVLADSDHTSAKIFCDGRIIAQPLMAFRASTIPSAAAGRMLNTWCEDAGFTVLHSQVFDLEFRQLDIATRAGLFFGNWDERLRKQDRQQATELSEFLAKIDKCDKFGSFCFFSKFYVNCAVPAV